VTETVEPMAAQIDQQRLAEDLVAQAREEGVQLVGEGGLLTGLTKAVVETALEEEISGHLGYDKHDPAGRNGGNSGNGVRSKTVLTEIGPVHIGCLATGTAASSRRSCASGNAGWTASTRSCCR
jgi:putative transposase